MSSFIDMPLDVSILPEKLFKYLNKVLRKYELRLKAYNYGTHDYTLQYLIMIKPNDSRYEDYVLVIAPTLKHLKSDYIIIEVQEELIRRKVIDD